MAEFTAVSTDVALAALRARIELVTPVIDAMAEGEPLRRALRVYVKHYSLAIEQLAAGVSIADEVQALTIAAMIAHGPGRSSESFLALTDICALLSGQRVPERAELDV